MTEIQVLIPLSVFGDAKDLTPQGISDAITQVSNFKAQVAEQMARNDLLVNTIQMVGNKLESIWLDSTNELERAKAIRELFQDLKEFKG
jgi:hypothetical protein